MHHSILTFTMMLMLGSTVGCVAEVGEPEEDEELSDDALEEDDTLIIEATTTRIVYCNNNLSACRRTRSATYFRGRTAYYRRDPDCGVPFGDHRDGARYKLTQPGFAWKCLY